MFVKLSLRYWDYVILIGPETLANGWKLLRNSTNDGASHMVSELSMEKNCHGTAV